MKLTGIAIREMVRRPKGLILATLATVVATAAVVANETTFISAGDTMRKLMLQLGHNFLIVPKDSPYDRFWAADFGDQTMPEAYLDSLAAHPEIEALRYVAMLNRRVEVDGVRTVLTGVRFKLGAFGLAAKKKPTPGGFADFVIKRPDHAYLGADVARALRKDTSDTITIDGETFQVARVLKPEGTNDDLRIYIDLGRAQQMYHKARGSAPPPEPQINGLVAFGCVCPVRGQFTPLSYIQNRLEEFFEAEAKKSGQPTPDVIAFRSMFEARAESRLMTQSVGRAVAGALLVLCGLALALYMYRSVSERRYEIALLTALGYRPAPILVSVIAKALLIALVGGAGGLLVGTWVAVAAGPHIATVKAIAPQWQRLWPVPLVLAAGIGVAASLVAVLVVVRVDPADQLRNR